MPKRVISRDSHALMQGIAIPAHLFYEAELSEATSVFTKGEDFLQAADRLVRQVIAQRQFMSREPKSPEALERIIRVCERFPGVVLQLQKRQRGREPLTVQDEYDVQDLLHALIRLDFDDVRPEERTPSHAGSSPAMDFLLKVERIVVEAKMARDSMTAKSLGDELLADIGRYREHPDCRTLVCFVYDPHGQLPNPRGLERDLMKHSRDDLRVVVLIVPR